MGVGVGLTFFGRVGSGFGLGWVGVFFYGGGQVQCGRVWVCGAAMV